MFELADSGSSGDLPLLCPPLSSPRSLSLSLILPPSPSLSLTFSTCYATLLCHAALAAQVCGHVGTRKRTPPSQRLHLSTFLFLLSQPARALPLPLPLSRCASSSTPFHRRSPLPFLFFSFLPLSLPFPLRVKNSASRFFLDEPALPLSFSLVRGEEQGERSDRSVGGESTSRSSSRRRLRGPTFARTPVQEHIVTPSGSGVMRARCTAPDDRYSFIYNPYDSPK